MRNRKQYCGHISHCWNFAQDAAKKLVNQNNNEHLEEKLALSIFEKICSPYHYFIQNTEQEFTSQHPTKKQIAYAKRLGIPDPEYFSKEELFDMIDKKLTFKSKKELD